MFSFPKTSVTANCDLFFFFRDTVIRVVRRRLTNEVDKDTRSVKRLTDISCTHALQRTKSRFIQYIRHRAVTDSALNRN